jgi:uncharacterized protein YhaN
VRIDRIRLKNFCGVIETEVRFAPKGVTIVHGPNEAGKSTLMQGINVLFDHRDDSRKEEVRLTKPVDRDVGAEVEADVEIGTYQFTYFKRFHKDRETRLTVHAPKAENLTGREAHERVQQIMSGSLDTNLWMALRIVQGHNLEMPELHNQPALAQALDRAAGQAKSGEREEGLYEAARSEFLQYFTDKGKEKEDPVGRARTQAATTAEVEQGLQRQLKELEDQVTRFATLAKETDKLGRSLASLESAEKKAQEAWDVVSKLSQDVDRCKTAHQLAEHKLTAAKNAVQQRNQLVEAAKGAGKKVEEASANEVESAKVLASAKESLDSATNARDSARITVNQTESDERLRRADHGFRAEEFELVRLEERLEHVNTADAAASAARDVIAATAITEKLRALIRESELKLETARGILSTASPQLHIKALQRVPVTIDGAATTLAAGAERSTPVAESLSVRIGESVDIRVDPGTSAETLRQSVKDAEQALTKACGNAGVSSPEEAESAWQALQDATRTVADRDRVVKEHLRDLTHQELQALVQSTRAKVLAYPEKRGSTVSLPARVEDAKKLLGAVEKAAAEAKTAHQTADEVFSQVSEYHAKLREAYAAKAALLEQAKKDLTQVTSRLDEDRKVSRDTILASALTASEVGVKNTLDVLKTAETSLGNSDPQTTKTILETSTSAYKTAHEQHAAQERELLQLRTRLDLLGEQGLAEALTESQRIAFEAEDALARLIRRAMAAKLLFETLLSEREAMRRAYVAPLREGIERLGRHVFGPSLGVEVNESLYVVSRTIDGVTLLLEQLSTGAQEQMGLLVRLATASIVAKNGGIPLVLDDALGSTDETRLESMGAVLRIASQDTQTIILTCAPARYLHVGAEAMVRL